MTKTPLHHINSNPKVGTLVEVIAPGCIQTGQVGEVVKQKHPMSVQVLLPGQARPQNWSHADLALA